MSLLMRPGIMICLIACAIALLPAHAGGPNSHASMAMVAQPRGTGYFVGDKVTQRVLLESAGQPISPVSLPKPGRVSAWFERRTASIQSDNSSRRWLVIEYQILNAPPKLLTVKLPAWSLPIEASGRPPKPQSPTDPGAPAALAIPAASINIAPLSPPGSPAQVGAMDLRPDRLPSVIATAPMWRSIEVSAGAFCLTLIAWFVWIIWRNSRASATEPFASAMREMRALDDKELRTWQALHRAFDRTAGRVIQHSTLPVLFERAPQLIAARAQIEQFFAESSLLFFTTSASSGHSGTGRVSPHTLCAELRQIERRHER